MSGALPWWLPFETAQGLRVFGAVDYLTRELGREPTEAEVAQRVGIAARNVRVHLGALAAVDRNPRRDRRRPTLLDSDRRTVLNCPYETEDGRVDYARRWALCEALPGREKPSVALVLYVLAWQADTDGCGAMTVERSAELTGLSRRAVILARARLSTDPDGLGLVQFERDYAKVDDCPYPIQRPGRYQLRMGRNLARPRVTDLRELSALPVSEQEAAFDAHELLQSGEVPWWPMLPEMDDLSPDAERVREVHAAAVRTVAHCLVTGWTTQDVRRALVHDLPPQVTEPAGFLRKRLERLPGIPSRPLADRLHQDQAQAQRTPVPAGRVECPRCERPFPAGRLTRHMEFCTGDGDGPGPPMPPAQRSEAERFLAALRS